MVNTGSPSKACEPCRQRRVKCDYRRPGCQRCEMRLEKPRIVVPNPHSSILHRRPSEPPVTGDTTFPPAYSLTESWDVQIMPLVLAQFALPGAGGSIRVYGSLQCFVTLLPTAEPGSLLYLACHAVGYASLSNRRSNRELGVSHQRAYGQAIQGLRHALEDPVARRQDAILLTVWLLCLYELILGTSPDAPGPGPVNWASHAVALTGLLRARGPEQLSTATGCQLFQLAYHHIQSHVLNLGIEPPPEATRWFQTIQTSIDTNDYMYLFLLSFRFGDEAARLCGKASRSFLRASHTLEKLGVIESTIQEVEDLEVRIARSLDHLNMQTSSPLTSTASASTPIRKPFLVLHVQNHLSTCVLRMYCILLDLVKSLSQLEIGPDSTSFIQVEHLQKICVRRLQVYAERILCTVPRFMPDMPVTPPGWADGLRLMWPLRVILASSGVLETQREAARLGLRRIAYEVGIKQAAGSFFGADSATPETPKTHVYV